MKKIMTSALIVIAVAVAMVLLGSILKSIAWDGDFDGSVIGVALTDLGYIGAVLSGIVLTGVTVASAAKGEDKDEK